MNVQYPCGQRRGVWALDYLKIINNAEIVDQVGASGIALLMHVALTEHVKNYFKPPDFWSSQLRRAAGIRDDEAFAACRLRCVESGWLIYQPGPRRGTGIYWVSFPAELVDRLVLEYPTITGQTGDAPETNRKQTGKAPETHRNGSGDKPESVRNTTGGTPVLPSPSPFPSLSKREREAPAPSTDKKSENTQALKRALRRLGLSVAPDAVVEWADLLQGAVKARKIEEVIYALSWMVKTGSNEGVTVKYAKHAGPALANRARAELVRYRREEAMEKSQPAAGGK